jgi:methylthioribose-1-phosphate isomerase
MIQTVSWTGTACRLLDQTKLPTETAYVDITDEKQMWDAIKRLVVRGAPAIGVAAAFGVYLGVRDHQSKFEHLRAFQHRVDGVCSYLKTSRPTAVNLAWAVDRIRAISRNTLLRCLPDKIIPGIKKSMLRECRRMLKEDNEVCHAIGRHGARLLRRLTRARRINLLTHCNAGGLATVQYGTALAPIYVGKELGLNFHVYADETRPLLQGSRITAFELKQNGIPVTVICDSMAATVMKENKVSAVIVGTDRVAANGDVANKIGTLSVAILARHFGLPFYVACPTSTIDMTLKSGDQIPIEQRDPREITNGLGRQTAPDDVDVYNPAFDVTPHELVTAIITEKGVIEPPYDLNLASLMQPSR